MRDDVLARVEEEALHRFVHDCEATGHAFCRKIGGGDTDDPACEQARQAVAEAGRTREEWFRFDVGQELIRYEKTFPDDNWSVPALLRLVHDSCTQGPLVPDPVRRGIWATAGLARLAESGLPPDVVLRTAMRDELKRRITIAVVAAAVDTGRPESRFPPRVLQPWVDALQSCDDQRLQNGVVPANALSEVVIRALHGDFGSLFERWLDTASLADVLGWRLDAEAHAPLDESDLMLKGGDAAGQWIYDRNQYTSLREWHRPSLDWELRYATAPEITAQDAGVPQRLLAPRPAHLPAVVAELVRRTRSVGPNDHVVAGLTREELLEQTILLIGDGQPEAPVRLLTEAVRIYPQDRLLRNTLGFCLLPTDPAAALHHFERCSPGGRLQPGLLAINRAAALARLGRCSEALAEADTVTTDGTQVLLWPCAPLLLGTGDVISSLEATTPRQWAAQLRQILAA